MATQYVASNGFPFSDTLNDAIVRHIQNGLFENKGEYFTISGRGTDEFNKFKDLSNFIKREELLNAACTTTILIPYAQTVRALLKEPNLKKQIELQNDGWLDQMSFYPQFKEISEALGIKTQDLIMPAVTLINSLNQK